MTALAVGALVAAGLWSLLAFLAFDAVAYRSLRRAVARGDLSEVPGDHVRPVSLNALGVNPEITYRYTALAIPPGRAAVVRGAVHPAATYTSVMVYDRLLQSVLPEHAPGPTLLTERELGPDAAGRFTLVLAHADPGHRPWLDVSAVPDGILFERHIGAAPAEPSRVEVVAVDRLAAALAAQAGGAP